MHRSKARYDREQRKYGNHQVYEPRHEKEQAGASASKKSDRPNPPVVDLTMKSSPNSTPAETSKASKAAARDEPEMNDQDPFDEDIHDSELEAEIPRLESSDSEDGDSPPQSGGSSGKQSAPSPEKPANQDEQVEDEQMQETQPPKDDEIPPLV